MSSSHDKKQPLTDERFDQVIKFLKYWQGHTEFWPLVNEQLRIIAKEAAAPSATRRTISDPSLIQDALLIHHEPLDLHTDQARRCAKEILRLAGVPTDGEGA